VDVIKESIESYVLHRQVTVPNDLSAPCSAQQSCTTVGTERSQLTSPVLADHGPGAVPTEVRFWLRALDRRQGL
jgi:hypothetical protein